MISVVTLTVNSPAMRLTPDTSSRKPERIGPVWHYSS